MEVDGWLPLYDPVATVMVVVVVVVDMADEEVEFPDVLITEVYI